MTDKETDVQQHLPADEKPETYQETDWLAELDKLPDSDQIDIARDVLNNLQDQRRLRISVSAFTIVFMLDAVDERINECEYILQNAMTGMWKPVLLAELNALREFQHSLEVVQAEIEG